MLDSTRQDLDDADFLIELFTNKLPLAKAVYVATKLNIADCIGDEELQTTHIAQAVGANENNLYRLLRTLSSFGFFCEVNGHSFINTKSSNMLRRDYPGSFRELILWDAGPLTWKSLEGLYDCVVSGKTAFDNVFELPFFDYIEENPADKELLYKSLKTFNQMVIPEIIKSYDFSAFKSIVDIGGGEGDLLFEIHSKYPNIDCSILELSNMTLPKKITNSIKVVRGDFFNDILPNSDCYILKHILHDWNDEQSIQILTNCSNTLEHGGKLLVIETALVPGSPHKFISNMMDLDMMILTGGKERTPDEYKSIFAAAKLELSNVIQTGSPLYIIEATKG
jgi:hypothetical protein